MLNIQKSIIGRVCAGGRECNARMPLTIHSRTAQSTGARSHNSVLFYSHFIAIREPITPRRKRDRVQKELARTAAASARDKRGTQGIKTVCTQFIDIVSIFLPSLFFNSSICSNHSSTMRTDWTISENSVRDTFRKKTFEIQREKENIMHEKITWPPSWWPGSGNTFAFCVRSMRIASKLWCFTTRQKKEKIPICILTNKNLERFSPFLVKRFAANVWHVSK